MNFYYINLNRREDRKKHMEDQFKKYGFDETKIKRIEAIDCKKLVNILKGDVDCFKYINNCNNRYRARSPQTLGTVACVLSHFKALLEAKKNNLEYVFILEDDIDFEYINKWKNNLEEILEKCPENWNILQLYTSNYKIMHMLSKQKTLFTRKPNSNIKHYTYLGTVFYVIHKRGIDYLLNKYYNELENTITLVGLHPAADGILYNIPSSYIYNYPLIMTKDEEFETDLQTKTTGKFNRFGIKTNKIIREFYKKQTI